MKKRVLKRKKNIIVYKQRTNAGKAIVLAAAVCLFLTAAVPVCGKEPGISSSQQAPKRGITEIHHRHIGNASESGGCYNTPIKHEHIGNETTGGECFQKVVPHVHQGSESEGTGCYVVPVAHDHIGDEINGGPCYGPLETHTHTEGCFEEAACMRSFTPEEVISTEQRKCFQHQETTFVTARGTEVHDSCPLGTTSAEWTYCQLCGPKSPTIHDYSKEICGMEQNQVLKYEIVCPKKVDRYDIGCGKTDKDADSYLKTCEKTIDGYKIGCGLEDNEVCGRLIVENETAGKEEQVILRAWVEDLTGGKLKLAAGSYLWLDESGNRLGEGGQISVSENGTYSVSIKLENKDVNQQRISSRIQVDNVYKTHPTTSPKPTATPSAKPKPTSTPAASGSPKPTEVPASSAQPSPSDVPAPTEEPAPTGTPSFVSTPTPSGTLKPGAGGDSSDDTGDADSSEEAENGTDPEDGDKDKKTQKKEEGNTPDDDGQGGSKPVGGSKKYTSPLTEGTPAPSASDKPILKERKEITVPERKAAGESTYKVGQEEKGRSIFASPAVRVISITAGLAILLLGICLLLLYLRNSVKVYNDDGKGRMIYLGRCMVETEEDTYFTIITDAMVEKAYTNRYCIKPGLFLLGKKEEEELIVHKEAKKAAVRLDKEMIVML